MEQKYYEMLCQTAQAYKYGYIHQDSLINSLGNFIMWKINNAITPNIEKITARIDNKEVFTHGK